MEGIDGSEKQTDCNKLHIGRPARGRPLSVFRDGLQAVLSALSDVVDCRAAAADPSHHHHRADVASRPSEETPGAAEVPHDGGARAQTTHSAQGRR